MACEAMCSWWNKGLHGKIPSTHSLLVRCSIPEHFGGLALVSRWQVNIYDMLKSIPAIADHDTNAYFDTINTMLSVYEILLTETPVLFPQYGLDYGIVLNVLSFL